MTTQKKQKKLTEENHSNGHAAQEMMDKILEEEEMPKEDLPFWMKFAFIPGFGGIRSSRQTTTAKEMVMPMVNCATFARALQPGAPPMMMYFMDEIDERMRTLDGETMKHAVDLFGMEARMKQQMQANDDSLM